MHSNETPFGAMRYMEEHRKGKLKMVSIQNAYSLLQRRDEIGITEVLHKQLGQNIVCLINQSLNIHLTLKLKIGTLALQRC